MVRDLLPQELRRNDYSLDEQQEAVREVFVDFFQSVASSSVVRAAEPLGYDPVLWAKASNIGVVTMAVPESRGGDGATVVDLVLVAEQYGASLAPIPMVDAIAAARLLAALPAGRSDELLGPLLSGETVLTVALHPDRARQLVPAGAIAQAALALRGDELVVVPAPDGVEQAANLGGQPAAWWTIGDDVETLAQGDDAVAAFTEAVRVWKLLTAAALTGSADATVGLGVDFASSRKAFGQFIGTFQAISHSLVDAAILATGSRNLVRKAAWYVEYEPEAARELVPKAYVSACAAATKASTVGIHVQGGFGFTTESDMTLHFRRAKGWPLLAGRPAGELLAVADSLPMPSGI
ncbi:Acyl-CoA dehydrogenase [Rhodococcoides kyotonense]|uniref:Acyl-CoA dehydrogenase n=1 Tax=Rhodococcoides kyotonense TaxID=398843 RepID=A0A239M228_9NOCA|nr:Acyl-CoA dehydrogenase [Rhodococcus kyotonensis]